MRHLQISSRVASFHGKQEQNVPRTDSTIILSRHSKSCSRGRARKVVMGSATQTHVSTECSLLSGNATCLAVTCLWAKSTIFNILYFFRICAQICVRASTYANANPEVCTKIGANANAQTKSHLLNCAICALRKCPAQIMMHITLGTHSIPPPVITMERTPFRYSQGHQNQRHYTQRLDLVRPQLHHNSLDGWSTRVSQLL